MKVIKKILPFLILLFSLSNNIQAQSREQVQKAATAADAMSKVLKKLDEANKAKDVLDNVSKFAKAAKGFGAAATVLNVGISLFGGDEENIRLLKQITKMVAEVKAKLDKLEVEVKSGFEKLENANEYRSAQNQIFQSISHINSCMLKVQYYLNTQDEVAMREAAGDIMKINLDQLGTDMQNILRSCVGANGTLSSNLLDASIIQSHANIDFVKSIGIQLLSAISSAAFCESIYSQLSNQGNTAMQDAARRRVSSEYSEYMDQVEQAVSATLTRCADFKTITLYAKSAVEKVAALHGEDGYPDMAAKFIQEDLTKAWPSTEVIVASYRNSSKEKKFKYWNNFQQHGIPAIELKWKTKNHHGVVWIIPKTSFISAGQKWDNYLSNRPNDFLDKAVHAYFLYYIDENLHRYISDGGDRPFGPRPFCFVSRSEEIYNSFLSYQTPNVVDNTLAARSSYVNHQSFKIDEVRVGIDIFIPSGQPKY